MMTEREKAIRDEIGEELYSAAKKYLEFHPQYHLNDLYQRKDLWNEFVEWDEFVNDFVKDNEPIVFIVENSRGQAENNFFMTKDEMKEAFHLNDEEMKRVLHDGEFYTRSDMSYMVHVCESAVDLKECLLGKYNDNLVDMIYRNYSDMDLYDGAYDDWHWENDFDRCGQHALDLARVYMVEGELLPYAYLNLIHISSYINKGEDELLPRQGVQKGSFMDEMTTKEMLEMVGPNIEKEMEEDFIFDDELQVNDEKCEVLDGYLIATNNLVDRLLKQDDLYEIAQSMENINFYCEYNMRNGDIQVDGTYYVEDEQKEFKIVLYNDEKNILRGIMEQYCEKINDTNCLGVVNEVRRDEGIELIVPEHKALDKIIESAEKNRSDASKGNMKTKEEKMAGER